MQNYYTLGLNTKKISLENLEILKMTTYEHYGHDGIEEYQFNEAQIDEILGEKGLCGGNIDEETVTLLENTASTSNSELIFYFCGENADLRLNSFKKLALQYTPEETFKVDTVLEQNWNQEWMKHYETIRINKNLQVVPAWERPKQGENSSNIYINPAMAFGTGDHETTFLSLKKLTQLIDSKNSHFQSCLDFGCGSGILGLAAYKLIGPKTFVEFVDIDQEALNNTLENIQLNNINTDEMSSNLVLTMREKYLPQKKFDLIFANILLDILIQEKTTLLESLAPEGIIIISGVLVDQVEELLQNFKAMGLEEVEVETKNDWAVIVMKNNKGSLH
jgi:ribosomal protein L11 methyltransferase